MIPWIDSNLKYYTILANTEEVGKRGYRGSTQQERARVQRGVHIMILILLGLIPLEGRLFLSRKAFDIGYNFFFEVITGTEFIKEIQNFGKIHAMY